jgi:hypothetical protein
MITSGMYFGVHLRNTSLPPNATYMFSFQSWYEGSRGYFFPSCIRFITVASYSLRAQIFQCRMLPQLRREWRVQHLHELVHMLQGLQRP